MWRILRQQFYAVAVLLILVSVGLFYTVSDYQYQQARKAGLQASPYYEAWQSFGVVCHSAVNLLQPHILFDVRLIHPPGDRELIMETVRHLVRTGHVPKAWPEETVQEFIIRKTTCYHSWSEWAASFPYFDQDDIRELLNDPDNPTEEDYRQALLRMEYTRMGTVEEALAWYPLTEEVRSPE